MLKFTLYSEVIFEQVGVLFGLLEPFSEVFTHQLSITLAKQPEYFATQASLSQKGDMEE